eukprot:763066-Hanusia_phi.AAC.5
MISERKRDKVSRNNRGVYSSSASSSFVAQHAIRWNKKEGAVEMYLGSVTIANTGYGSPTEPVFNVVSSCSLRLSAHVLYLKAVQDLGYQSSVGSPAYYVEF